MRHAKLAVIVLVVAVVSIFGLQALLGYVYWQTCRNRALADMMALTAGVEHFRQTHGRLPLPDEFAGLHPAPGFQVPFATKSPETQTHFIRTEQRASEITDPFKRPFYYEPENGRFVIRSHGPDGIKSSDDFIYETATK